jgi:hypothetical protein
MFQELKIDSRRIPSRFGDAEPAVEEPQPEPAAEPIVAQPEPVAVSPPPETIRAKPRRKAPVIEAPAAVIDPPHEPLIHETSEREPVPNIAEVEYRWDTYWSQEASDPNVRDEALFTDWLPETVMKPLRK